MPQATAYRNSHEFKYIIPRCINKCCWCIIVAVASCNTEHTHYEQTVYYQSRRTASGEI